MQSLHSRHGRAVTILASVVLSALTSSIITAVAITAYATKTGAVVSAPISGSLTAVAEDARVKSVVDTASRAVVSIIVTRTVTDPYNSTGPDLELIFPVPQGLPDVGKQKVGGGSGFIVRADGLIVTNRHVVADTKAEYSVVLHDGREFTASVIGKDPVMDIAVLKIDAKDLPVVAFGNSDELYVGQTVLAIGNSLAELQNSVTKGIVSGLGRQVIAGDDMGDSEVLEEAIQTDAAINPGNSGGPLLDLNARVVGVNTATSRRGQLIGFAIPINSVQRIIESAVKHGRIVHPWMGVRYQMITKELAAAKKLPLQSGALVADDEARPNSPAIVPNSPAAKAGLRGGDIIIKANGQVIDEQHSLAKEIAKYSVGDTIVLTIMRGGKEQTVSVVLGEFPNQ